LSRAIPGAQLRPIVGCTFVSTNNRFLDLHNRVLNRNDSPENIARSFLWEPDPKRRYFLASGSM
jgi:hypothetical protein